MTLRGRALRGGITIGMAYADHSFVTGPAHLAAVLLEEKEAKNPRVLIADDIYTEIIDTVDDDTFQLLQHYLLRDTDNKVFVNYLLGIEEDGVQDDIQRALAEHRDYLNRALSSAAGIPGVYEKYMWAAGYHNYVRATFHEQLPACLDVPDIAPSPLSRLTRGSTRPT
ncbi:hypothetical protein LK459_13095 [Gordonia otitidis]|uniref:hypothetical protein n=1 Tax=Gordonia otitidis TaxID=249058 RepID=UPI001D135519|nr:hypothetical protein [Gordonia otitidis]UEA57557.1 hypothetical protein LK459_13095 [Gordonia otitidis]